MVLEFVDLGGADPTQADRVRARKAEEERRKVAEVAKAAADKAALDATTQASRDLVGTTQVGSSVPFERTSRRRSRGSSLFGRIFDKQRKPELTPEQKLTEAEQQRAAAVGAQVSQNLADPTLPAGAVQTATKLGTGADQFGDPTKIQQAAPGAITAAQGEAAIQEGPDNLQAAQIDPALVGQAAQAEAATGVLPDEITTSGRLTTLLSSGDEEGIPAFAAPALAKVDRMLAARGLSRTSIGADQLTNMLIQAAIPLAQADSQALVANFQQNLSNEQQAAMMNAGFDQQALLSNQASENAASQFNASSQAQTDQFMASLKATVEKSNTDRITAMSQFNAGSENAISQFNANLAFNRDQFNTQNAIAIEQSNVSWRRDMNKIDTQATNAVNQANAMNSFNLSNQALTFMWQEMRDAAKWSFEGSQNDKQRAASLAQAALGNESIKSSADAAKYATLGAAAINLWLA